MSFVLRRSGRALVERLGADHIVDYTSEDFTKTVHDMDAVFDLMGGETLDKAFSVVRPGGKVLSVAALPEPITARKDLGRGWGLATLFWFASFKLRAKARKHDTIYRFLFMHPSGAELTELAAMIDSKKLEPVIDKIFAFADIDQAFAYLEQGRAKGKVVVTMV